MDSSYCAHPKSFAVTFFGLSEDAMSRQGLCFHGNDSEPARDELFEPRNPPKCEHNYVKTPYHVGMCIIYECTKCGDEYEKDVS